MLNKLWDSKRESNYCQDDHSGNKVVRLFDKSKFDRILEKDVFDQTSFDSLKSNSYHKPCRFALKPIVDAHIHEPEFVVSVSVSLFDRLKDFCATIQSLIFMLDRVIADMLAFLKRSLNHWETLSCQNALINDALPRHKDNVTW